MDERWQQIDDPTTYYVSKQYNHRLAVTYDFRGWSWGIKTDPEFQLIASSMYGDENGDKRIFYATAEDAMVACQRYFDTVVRRNIPWKILPRFINWGR
jgi:hypothetical protein